MRYSVIELLLVWICFCVRLADTLGDDFRITFLVTRILAIFTLHPSRVLQEVSTQSAPHDIVELLK